MNIELARTNMVKQQIQPWHVLDQRVLDAVGDIPREKFVPQRYRSLAFSDTSIPLEHGQLMLRPTLEGRILQSLRLLPTDRVLEVGTGSGYLTACLAKLAGQVESVDIHRDFIEQAAAKLAELNINNVTLREGDASQHWGQAEQYDAVVISGSMPSIPDAYRKTLALNGRLFAIIGYAEDPIMQAVLITRSGNLHWMQESLFETWVAPLANLSKEKGFSL